MTDPLPRASSYFSTIAFSSWVENDCCGSPLSKHRVNDWRASVDAAGPTICSDAAEEITMDGAIRIDFGATQVFDVVNYAVRPLDQEKQTRKKVWWM